MAYECRRHRQAVSESVQLGGNHGRHKARRLAGGATGFTIAPIIAGAEKFFHLLCDRDEYLAPWIANIVHNGHAFMLAAGAVEIVDGIVVAIKPKFGGYLVAAWLAAIILNLMTFPGYFDVALRDL